MSEEKLQSPTVLDLERGRVRRIVNLAPHLRALCIARGIVTGKPRNGEAAERRLLAMLEKSHSHAVVYDGYGWTDLKDFVRIRGLQSEELDSLWEKIEDADVETAAIKVGAREKKKEVERERKERAIEKKERQQAEEKSEKVQAGKVVAAAEIPQVKIFQNTERNETTRHEDTDAREVPERSAKEDDVPDNGALLRRSRRLASKSLDTSPWTADKPSASRTAVIRKATKPGSKYPSFAARNPPTITRVDSYGTVREPNAGTRFLKRQARELSISVLEDGDRKARFNFLGLPTELRNLVYHSVCRTSSTMFSPRQPAITRTCRLIRDESIPVFYGHNRFGILTPRPRGLGHVRHRFNLVGEDPWLETQLDVNMMRVRSFEFRCAVFDNALWVDFKFGINDYEVKHRSYDGERGIKDSITRTEGQVLEGELDPVMEHAGSRAQLASVIESVIGSNSTAEEIKTLAHQFECAEGFSAESLIYMTTMLIEYVRPSSDITRLWGPPRYPWRYRV